MLAELSRRLGVVLSPRRFTFPDDVRAEVDGVDPEARELVEVWAHQGPPKAAQKQGSRRRDAAALRRLHPAHAN